MFRVLAIGIALIGCLIIAAGILKRRRSLPCPWWLTFLLENPYIKWVAGSALLIDRMNIKPGMRVLDVGCGPGRLTIPLAEHVGPEGSIVALDIQKRMLQKVEERIEENGLTNVKTIRGGAGRGKIRERDSFDRAVLVAALGEIADKKKALEEIYRALKAGGLLSVTEVLPDPDYQRRSTVSRLASGVGFKFEESFGNLFAFTMNFSKPG